MHQVTSVGPHRRIFVSLLTEGVARNPYHNLTMPVIMTNGALLTAIGMAIGLLGSVGTAHSISQFLFAMSASDPITLLAGCALLSAVPLATNLIPAARTTRIDPQVALRHE
jgi:putative ABC transport system permease protein